MTAEHDYDPDGDENEIDDEIEDQEIEHRTSLQAAIAWIMTRNSELAFALAEPDLATIDAIIRRAKLTPTMSQEKAWAELQAVVANGRVSMWGHEFELPADYEHGDVWPRGPLRQLASNDISNMCLFDAQGMAVRPPGMITPGQVWYCRALVKTEELELAFPAPGNASERRPKRDHKKQTAEDIYLRLLQTRTGWDRLKVKEQLYQMNLELRALGEAAISERLLVEIRGGLKAK